MATSENNSLPLGEHLVEAGIYADDLEKVETFYQEVLGLEMLTKEPGRHVFFRVGESVLMIVRAEAILPGGMHPPHGVRGPGHFALGIGALCDPVARR